MVMQQLSASRGGRALAQNNLLWLTILVLVESLHFVFARLLSLVISPDISAMYVQAVGTLLFGSYALATGKLDWRIFRRHWLFFLSIALLIGVSTNMSYRAITVVDPGTASMLGKVSIIFSLGFGFFWLKERLTLSQWIGAGISIIGSFVIAFQPGDFLQWGALLILGGTLMYALHTAIVKRFGGQMDFVNFFFFRILTTTAILFVIAAGRGVLAWPTLAGWGIVSLTAVMDVIISRLLFYVALRRMTMNIHTIVLTLSPVATILWSLLLFDTLPGLQQVIGGGAVLLGVLIVTWPGRGVAR
jgi:drug/metabolite transporter (DMT)-like permease